MRAGSSAVLPSEAPSRRSTSVGIVDAQPATDVGLLSLGDALIDALRERDVGVSKMSLTGSAPLAENPGASCDAVALSPPACAAVLNSCDIAIVEYSAVTPDSRFGERLIAVMRELTVPSIVVVADNDALPSSAQQTAMATIAHLAAHLVVVTEASRERLSKVYGIDVTKIDVIPYGARGLAGETVEAGGTPDIGEIREITKLRQGRAPLRPVLLTWGQLQPGKGIERMIAAMASIHESGDLQRSRYLVAGRTQPDELEANGESYRNTCLTEAWRTGVAASVTFDSRFRSDDELAALIGSATAVVLPYDSPIHVASRVLVEAVAAGKPVIATAFPHAIDLLASGAGIVVDHDDRAALIDALRMVVHAPEIAEDMADEARRLAPRFAWPRIAGDYLTLTNRLLETEIAAE